MLCISLVRLSYLATMCAKYKSVNNTDVHVVWCPPDEKSRGVIQVIVKVGKRQPAETHVAFQNLLAAVKQLQDLTR